MSTEYNLQEVSFILNIDSKLLEPKEHSVSEMHKRLSDWGNYIIIPSGESSDDRYIQFIPNEDFLRILSELKVQPSRSRSILMSC
ncbi:hypothetical protein [Pedobacter frigoris]|uniref:Uncharacterized protein n=1 Tax=Pedobacter frigoris TaxID=2571272 RepID=A0A4U1CJ24_9SPHI|nr:hypothetical protein [Pedobacter frigoris]TKC06949.1 hypothetical protein FA047_06670 [Pedobacter frigoris]